MADKLDTYRKKRHADATPEPGVGGGTSDEVVSSSGPRKLREEVSSSGPRELGPSVDVTRRFTIQEHHATRLHWDLRLEREGVLVSFAVPNGLPPEPGVNKLAVHTEDHPLEYLTFHGEIPAGQYGAGSMTIWDTGTYEELKWEDRKIEIALHGERGLAEGRYALFPIGPDPKDWMIHRMDPPADAAREPMPDRVVPMLATTGALPAAREDDRWAYEIKWDGVRALAYSEPGTLRLESRNLRDITASYPELSRLNRALSHHSAVLDGEIVAFDNTARPPRPSFGLLQRRMHVASPSSARRLAQTIPVVYVVFDLLWLDGHSLLRLPYEERRAQLVELGLTGERWQTPDHVVGNGTALLEASAAQGLEGVMAKRLGSCYEPGRRSRDWVKVKNKQREDFDIVGWLPGEGRRRERIGALLLAHEGRFVGRVGTGFDEAELRRLAALLAGTEVGEAPVENAKAAPREAIWVHPRLVCEVEFAEWTSDRILRHPSYKGLRESEALAPLEPLMTVEGRQLKLSNLDKVLYPAVGFTKGDVIDYLRHIAPVLLPHLEGRPLTLKRYPNGVDGQFFYEKNCPAHRPDWVRTAKVRMSSKSIDFCLCEDLPTLMWLGNLADLELHTSLSLAAEPLRPTILAFDLDPGPPATIVECCRVGLWLNGMFERLGLQSFAKTSGSKGLQVYVPLNVEDVDYESARGTKTFAKAVAELLEQSEPGLVVSRMTKALRPGKVLVDWSQNDDAKTTVNVYSLRAKDRPTVSTPVTWDEVQACLDAGAPDQLAFTADQVLERVARDGDLFAPVLSLVQELPQL